MGFGVHCCTINALHFLNIFLKILFLGRDYTSKWFCLKHSGLLSKSTQIWTYNYVGKGFIVFLSEVSPKVRNISLTNKSVIINEKVHCQRQELKNRHIKHFRNQLEIRVNWHILTIRYNVAILWLAQTWLIPCPTLFFKYVCVRRL